MAVLIRPPASFLVGQCLCHQTVFWIPALMVRAVITFRHVQAALWGKSVPLNSDCLSPLGEKQVRKLKADKRQLALTQWMSFWCIQSWIRKIGETLTLCQASYVPACQIWSHYTKNGKNKNKTDTTHLLCFWNHQAYQTSWHAQQLGLWSWAVFFRHRLTSSFF